jgi:hypothetical protein
MYKYISTKINKTSFTYMEKSIRRERDTGMNDVAVTHISVSYSTSS